MTIHLCALEKPKLGITVFALQPHGAKAKIHPRRPNGIVLAVHYDGTVWTYGSVVYPPSHWSTSYSEIEALAKGI